MSNKKNVGRFRLKEKKHVPIIIPISAPWKDIPPSQILIIFKDLRRNNLNYKKLINSGAKYIAISSFIWDNPNLKPDQAIKKFK